MFFIQTEFKKCDLNYQDLLDEIDKKINIYSTYLLNNKRYGFKTKINYNTFEDLLDYRSILISKINCESCLCNYSKDQIINIIRKLTNSIC